MSEIEEAIEEYAEAYAELYWQRDQGHGQQVRGAEAWFEQATERLRRLGFDVGLDRR